MPRSFRPPRNGQEGGITILVALILVSVTAIAAFGLSREAFRDAMITGNDSTGRKAYEMADSGVDYVISWSGDPTGSTAGSATATTLMSNLASLTNAADLESAQQSGVNIDASGSVAFTMAATSMGGDMTPATTGYLQSSQVKPAWDLEMRWLGTNPLADTSQGMGVQGNRSWWLIKTTGRANVGTTGLSFISKREALIDVPR